MSDELADGKVRRTTEINKEWLIKFAIAAGAVLVLLGLLFLFAFLSRRSWSDGMAEQVQTVLSENDLEYSVGEMDQIHTGVSASLVSFTLSEPEKHGVIVRVSTLYGPIPAVFIYNEENRKASFVGFADLKGIAENIIVPAVKGSQIPYWEGRIPKIVGAAKNIRSKEETK
ncbi:MAG: hypothetical protein IIU15_03480 [Treponema sp.]|nr:hypothetical protein [Treponema sp.]